MLLEIDDTIIKELESNPSREFIKGLELLAQAAEEGKHFVIGSFTVLKSLSQFEGLSDIHRKIFKQISKKRATIGAVYNQVQGYAKVTADMSSRIVKQDNQANDEKVIYEVSINFFDNSRKIAELSLVVENKSDGVFYEKVVRKYIEEKNIGLEFLLNIVAGGGATTYEIYEHAIDAGNPTLVIVDSDKKNEKDSLGPTATQVKKVFNSCSNRSLTNCVVLNVREKENLINPDMYFLAYKSKDYTHLNFWAKLYVTEGVNYQYLDVKDGIKYHELSQYPQERKKICTSLHQINSDFPIDNELINKNRDDFFPEEKKKILLSGIGGLIGYFIEDILDDKLTSCLEEKEAALQNNPTCEPLQKEIATLREKQMKGRKLFDLIESDTILSNDYKRIINSIITWGCCYKIRVS